MEESTSLNDSNGARKKILIVDDEPDVTFTIKVILTSNGYLVDAFEDAEEALANFFLCSLLSIGKKDQNL